MRVPAQALGSALLGALLAISCSQAGPPAARPSPVTSRPVLVMGDWEAPDTFDPLPPATLARLRPVALVFARLWTFDPRLRPVPDLAARIPTREGGDVEIGGGGMTVRVRLRSGLRWSDGSALTADDVAFTWRSICSPGSGAALAYACPLLQDVEAAGGGAVTFRFNRVYGSYLSLLGDPPVLPRSRLAAVPPARWPGLPFFAAPDLASGPFRLRSRSPNVLVFDRNPLYHGRQAYLAQIALRLYPSHDAMLYAARNGEVDVLPHLGPADLPFAPAGALVGHVRGGLREEMLVPSAAAGLSWTGDGAVLTALGEALDRRALSNSAFGGAAQPLASVLPPVLGFPASAPPQRLTEAQDLLLAHGWRPERGGVRARAGHRLAFRLTTVCDDPVRAAEAAVLKSEWQDVGADVSTGCTVTAAAAEAVPGLALVADTFGPDPAALSRPDWPACPAARPGLAAAEAALDPALRKRRYEAAAAAWAGAGCAIPLLMWPEVSAATRDLHGFEQNPTAATDLWNAGSWWLAP